MEQKPTKYKSRKWLNMKMRKFVFGIDAKVNGEWHSVCEGKKPLMFDDRKEAIKKVKQLNKELRNEQ